MNSIVIGITINALLTFIGIISTVIIAQWYGKKSKLDIHFNNQKNNTLKDLIHRTGNSFSQFKEECKHIMNKRQIYEHDLVAFGTKNYDRFINNTERNKKYVIDSSSYYLESLNLNEYNHHVSFFNTMLRFVRELQIKKNLNHFNDDDDIAYALKHLNDDLKIIKSQGKEYDEISHVICSRVCLSRKGSLGIKGIKCYKSPSPIH